MARYYTTRDFFRQMPKGLLARYFQGRGVLGDLDFTAMKDAQPEKLFAAWLKLPDIQRNALDAEFLEIFELSCEKGFRAILDEAQWHLRADPERYKDFVEKLAALANHYERAMVTFLDHAQFWKGATLFYRADTLSYWRKRKNLPHRPAAVDRASVDELAGLIRTYFHHTEGRGIASSSHFWPFLARDWLPLEPEGVVYFTWGGTRDWVSSSGITNSDHFKPPELPPWAGTLLCASVVSPR